jgi:hypothetical protein
MWEDVPEVQSRAARGEALTRLKEKVGVLAS